MRLITPSGIVIAQGLLAGVNLRTSSARRCLVPLDMTSWPWSFQWTLVSWLLGFIALFLWAILSALQADKERSK